MCHGTFNLNTWFSPQLFLWKWRLIFMLGCLWSSAKRNRGGCYNRRYLLIKQWLIATPGWSLIVFYGTTCTRAANEDRPFSPQWAAVQSERGEWQRLPNHLLPLCFVPPGASPPPAGFGSETLGPGRFPVETLCIKQLARHSQYLLIILFVLVKPRSCFRFRSARSIAQRKADCLRMSSPSWLSSSYSSAKSLSCLPTWNQRCAKHEICNAHYSYDLRTALTQSSIFLDQGVFTRQAVWLQSHACRGWTRPLGLHSFLQRTTTRGLLYKGKGSHEHPNVTSVSVCSLSRFDALTVSLSLLRQEAFSQNRSHSHHSEQAFVSPSCCPAP